MLYLDDPGSKRVLVVEDELAMRRAMMRALGKAGYECIGAVNVAEARNHLDGTEFGAVITDLRMWGEDGIELVRYIGDEHPATLTIVVTGFADDRMADTIDRSGAFALLRKPFELPELVEKVSEALEVRAEKMAQLRHVTAW